MHKKETSVKSYIVIRCDLLLSSPNKRLDENEMHRGNKHINIVISPQIFGSTGWITEEPK